jgi:hypothetical protein
VQQHPNPFLKPLFWGGGSCINFPFMRLTGSRIAQGDPHVNKRTGLTKDRWVVSHVPRDSGADLVVDGARVEKEGLFRPRR